MNCPSGGCPSILNEVRDMTSAFLSEVCSEDIHNQLRARFRGLQVQNPAKSSPLLECEYLRNDASQTKPSLDFYRHRTAL